VRVCLCCVCASSTVKRGRAWGELNDGIFLFWDMDLSAFVYFHFSPYTCFSFQKRRFVVSIIVLVVFPYKNTCSVPFLPDHHIHSGFTDTVAVMHLLAFF